MSTLFSVRGNRSLHYSFFWILHGSGAPRTARAFGRTAFPGQTRLAFGFFFAGIEPFFPCWRGLFAFPVFLLSVIGSAFLRIFFLISACAAFVDPPKARFDPPRLTESLSFVFLRTSFVAGQVLPKQYSPLTFWPTSTIFLRTPFFCVVVLSVSPTFTLFPRCLPCQVRSLIPPGFLGYSPSFLQRFFFFFVLYFRGQVLVPLHTRRSLGATSLWCRSWAGFSLCLSPASTSLLAAGVDAPIVPPTSPEALLPLQSFLTQNRFSSSAADAPSACLAAVFATTRFFFLVKSSLSVWWLVRLCRHPSKPRLSTPLFLIDGSPFTLLATVTWATVIPPAVALNLFLRVPL